MGQAGIHSSNKTGYSMFWNSMWDSKINYSNYLKEDFFFKIYINHLFGDCLSMNIFKFKKINIKHAKKIKNKKEFFNYNLRNRPIIYSSKIWILRYQKWVVLYNYYFISKIKKPIKFDLFSTYNRKYIYIKYSNIYLSKYNFFIKQIKV